jgi:hypothetical protein
MRRLIVLLGYHSHMAPNDIAKHLRRQPFLPLRIHLSNGAVYDVAEPWHTGLWMTELFIGLEPDADGIPTRSMYCDTRHITQVEPLANGSTPHGNGRGA